MTGGVLPALLAALAAAAAAAADPAPDPRPAPSATAPATADKAPAPRAAPTAEQVERTIATLAEERRRAGSADRQRALAARLADAWVVRARQHLEGGERDQALDAYDRALALVPSHGPALVEAGWVQLEAGQPERARGLAEVALAHDPDSAHARALRGEVFYREERLEDAVQDLELAARGLPGNARVNARLEKFRRDLEAQRAMRRAGSAHFTLLFDDTPADQALRPLLLDALERAHDDLRREITVPALPPISVIVYTREAFHETTGTPAEVAGLFDGKVRLPAGGVDRVTPALERVVRHELVHALLHARGRGEVPRWLHEGMAQLYEPRDLRRTLAALREEARGAPVTLEPFSYPRAHAFVAFLDEAYSRNRIFWYIDLLAEQQPAGAAFEQAFGLSPAQAVEAFNRWLTDRG